MRASQGSWKVSNKKASAKVSPEGAHDAAVANIRFTSRFYITREQYECKLGTTPHSWRPNIFYVFTRALDFERRTYRGSSLVSSKRTFRRHLDAKTKVNVCEQWKMSCGVSAF